MDETISQKYGRLLNMRSELEQLARNLAECKDPASRIVLVGVIEARKTVLKDLEHTLDLLERRRTPR